MNIQLAKLSAEIAGSRAETLRWVIGIAIAQVGLIVTLGRFLHGP